MFRTLARLFLFRFLPRRLIPLLTAYELYRFVRRVRRPKADHAGSLPRSQMLESGDDVAASSRQVGRGARQVRA
jgi:hypothetical protein